MIEDSTGNRKSPLDWSAESALEAALESASKEGFRQVVIAMSKPGEPAVRFLTAGLTASERHRLISLLLIDGIATDLGLVTRGEPD